MNDTTYTFVSRCADFSWTHSCDQPQAFQRIYEPQKFEKCGYKKEKPI